MLISVVTFCLISCSDKPETNELITNEAYENGIKANEGFRRSLAFTKDWLTFADPASGLIPENLDKGKDRWNAHNAAADNYPFMVLTSYLLDKKLFNTTMLDMLHTEQKLTSRLGSLPDDYSFSKKGFSREKVDTFKIIFGTSEYIKDGILPLTEYLGISPWSDRMFDMLNDLSTHLKVATYISGDYYGNSVETEINGELLQSLTRSYWITGDEKYLNWAVEIGDYYLVDDKQDLSKSTRLRLRDHGCEIVGGLSELYATLYFANPEKKKVYQPKIHKLLNRLIEIARNDDGLFYNEINMLDGEIIDSAIADTWGYILNAFYTVYLIDNITEYKDAVLKPLSILSKNYHNYNWESVGSDGFADAIEGGINIYNRERVPELADWINTEIQIMWSLQDSAFRESGQKYKNRGVIEGWHGDGNFARTSLMYCLWKTNGITIDPWREDVVFGSTLDDDVLYYALKAENDWEGTLMFGQKRHEKFLKLPMDYPRINQFPEWFTLNDDKNYELYDEHSGKSKVYSGIILNEGLNISLKKDITYLFKLSETE